MNYVDTHAHLDTEEFQEDLPAVIARAHEASVNTMICPGITADSSQAVVRLAAENREIFAAVGIQPNHTGEAASGDWDRIVSAAEKPRVVAIGETGLDRHWDFTPLEVQKDYFDRHLRLAQDRGLPIIIHCREAEADLLPMLREAVDRAPISGVLHAFSGDQAFAAECLGLGLQISFAGPVTYTNKKFETLREAARSIPDDRLLIETDSPYLVPHPLRGKRKRNEPANVIHTAQCLAEIRNCKLDELAALTTSNARRLFGLE
jgi:TatD DNase family protein